ncbi:multicopper oxidase [Pyrenophora seminiperda CCB06]|uniref:Multicopper oxidase n=1 Tax=Pyrenophora seminiperda CCB06 TaxID=1302712 RepID=A0A3M7LVD6_9PLEO|nr:multicopper oxidase [Pyrenophora seminiperda CCB06]
MSEDVDGWFRDQYDEHTDIRGIPVPATKSPNSSIRERDYYFKVMQIHTSWKRLKSASGIASHVGMGFSVQILEREQYVNLPDKGAEWYRTCKNWDNYKAESLDVWGQHGSGL